eukprot:CAMPEP_0184644588 /NCGR_PEP_ID=MMETSP0308-20130426/1292_1 /TAXON_ID=38269 /ORGANISM="Gloeochaete witrockiana, Strain SAG 46.84" /LENGTH=33 /DNA_ID= /DNA_START= /DNA_END= /DNA_ORIENTATION=
MKGAALQKALTKDAMKAAKPMPGGGPAIKPQSA